MREDVMTRFSSHSIAPLAAGVVSLMLSACAAHPAPKLVPPNAPVAPAENVLLDETFERYSPYWRQVRGHWAVTSGRLLQTRDDMRDLNTVLFYDPLMVSDAEITADAAMLSDMPQFPIADDAELLRTRRQVGGAGIVFRYQDENNFYLFRLAGEDGVVLGKVVDGAWYELANPRAADFAGLRLRSEASYPLRVRVVGHRIQCWIGNRAVANLEDGSFGTGRIGLTTFRSKAAFTSLRVVER
jgi:hypothetical protein